MPNRILKESIKTSEKINSLSFFAEVVFYRLIVTCDDYGRMDGRGVLLRNTLFPIKESVTTEQIEDALAQLEAAGLITIYTVKGRPYLMLPTWSKHQRVRTQARKYPSIDEADCNFCNLSPQIAADCSELQRVAADCGLNPIQSESNPKENPIQIQSNPIQSESNPKENPNIPSLREVIDFIEENGLHTDGADFHKQCDKSGWTIYGKPIDNWKGLLISMEKNYAHG